MRHICPAAASTEIEKYVAKERYTYFACDAGNASGVSPYAPRGPFFC